MTTSTKHQRRYRQYQRILCRPFSPSEVVDMHLYCLVYQATVRRGGKPTIGEDRTFRLYNRALLKLEVPHEW